MPTSQIATVTPMELYMIVKDAELIRRLMVTRSGGPISAREISRRMGWESHSYMNRILNGQVRTVTTDTAVKVAYLLGVPVDLIFTPKVSSDSGQNVRRPA